MEILIVIAATIVIAAVALFALWATIRMVIYLCQEINHSVRKFKRELKQAIWDIEWKIKLMKGK